jgi:hypothetical protein
MEEKICLRNRTKQMFRDFLSDARSADLITGNPTLLEVNKFIDKWTEKHFPLPFADEIDSLE